MPLPPSGSITLSQVNTELGQSTNAAISLNAAAVRSLFGVPSGAISLSNGYGKSLSTPTVEYLVVAGGGAGSSGGGGAGGLLTATGYAVTVGSPITVTVGAGGSANGGNSVFGSITCIGGGAGGYSFDPGADGGSGGGGGNSSAGGNGTAGQGYAGSSTGRGAGGGGAGGPGVGLVGGPGVTSSITGSAVTYAVGGSDASYSSTPGSGGQGFTSSSSGIAGIVSIRYPNTYPAAASTTGAPTITNAGGYRVYTWTSVGTWSITF